MLPSHLTKFDVMKSGETSAAQPVVMGIFQHFPMSSPMAGAQAIQIPRSRFAPVKKCDDLLALRSDAYKLTEETAGRKKHTDRMCWGFGVRIEAPREKKYGYNHSERVRLL